MKTKKQRAAEAFIREAKKYVRFLRKRIADGDYDKCDCDKPLFRAHDRLVAAERPAPKKRRKQATSVPDVDYGTIEER